MKNSKTGKFRTLFIYFNAALLIMLLGAGTYYAITLYSKAQSCFTMDQVQQSSKCLYIYQNGVYEKGTREAPHQGNPCGSDVTSIIPNSHMLDKVGHLDPNYQGDLCSNTPVPTSTPTPIPTETPVPTTAPTNTPVPSPTSAQSAANPTATPTTPPIGGAPISTATPTMRVSSSVIATATPTLRPTASSTDSAELTTETPEPTALTTLPVTGRLEWLAVALIPVSLIIIGVIF